MKIGLHDSKKEYLKGKTFPNYALWWNPIVVQYDKVYSSKIFDFTPENSYLQSEIIKRGRGCNIHLVLPDEIDSMFPELIMI